MGSKRKRRSPRSVSSWSSRRSSNRRSFAPIRTGRSSPASSSTRSCASRGARTRRTRRATTIATTISTSPGMRCRAMMRGSGRGSTSSSTASPIAPPTWTRCPGCANGSRRNRASAKESTTASEAPAYTNSELMAVRAAKELRDGDVVFVGIGLPNLACNLARATHAPNLVLIYESGAVGAVPDRLPVSIGDPALVTDSLAVASMADIFQLYLQGGRIQVGFLGGAQVDRFGNLNSTVIGPYDKPKVRLPGSGGACEIAIHAERVVVVAPLTARSFPAAVDFITSPGQAGKYGTRRELGLPGRGPQRIVTDVGVLEPSQSDGELELVGIYPKIAVD